MTSQITVASRAAWKSSINVTTKKTGKPIFLMPAVAIEGKFLRFGAASSLGRLILKSTCQRSSRSLFSGVFSCRTSYLQLRVPHKSWRNQAFFFSQLSSRHYSSAFKMGEANKQLRYIDIGINLGDPVFRGNYHGKQVHDDDLADIIERAREVGCTKFMVTGSDLQESEHAVQLAHEYPGFCYATVGVHPCQAKLFESFPGGPSKLLEQLKELALKSKGEGYTVAFGEIGLDYDRLFLSPKDQQLKYFEAQLDLAIEIQLPLFLHSRAASEDFERLLASRLEKLPKKGLVHSFTGTVEEMQRLLDLGLDIGVNGCSMKTEENLEVIKAIPLDRLQIETDGPWCEIRASHASAKYLDDAPALPKAVKKEKWQKGCMIKGRNEPVSIIHVAHVIAKVKGTSVEEVCEAAWNNSVKMFGLGVKTE